MTTRSATSWYRSLETWQLVFFLVLLAATNVSIAINQISLGLSLAILIARWGVRHERPPLTGVEASAALLALWALAMIPFSADPAQSMVYYRRFFLFSVLWIGSSLATTESRRFWMLTAMVTGAAGVSLYGEIQIAIQAGGLFTKRFLGATNPMTSAALLMMAVMVSLAFLWTRGIRRRWRVVLAVAVLPVALALMQTMTRSALLGGICGVGAMVLLVRPRLFLIFLVGILVLGGLLVGFGEDLVPDRLWQRIDPEDIISGRDTNPRLEMWRGGWQMIKAHPITGVGDCDLLAVAPQYYGDQETVYFGHLHNNLVMLGVIWGIPGFILAQIFTFVPLIILVRRWRQLAAAPDGPRGSPALAGWILGAVGVWASFYVAGFTEWYFGDAEPLVLYLAIIGVALGGNKNGPNAGSRSISAAD